MSHTTQQRRRGPTCPAFFLVWTALASIAAAALGQHGPATVLAGQAGPTSEVFEEVPVPTGDGQFDPFEPPPYDLDNVQGEWINLETQLIKPILVTANGKHVVVANPADNRLVVFDDTLSTVVAEIVLGQGIATLAERPGNGISTDPALSPSPAAVLSPQTPSGVAQAPQEQTQEAVPVPVAANEIWVSVRHQNAVAVINTRNWRLKALVRAPIGVNDVGARRAAAPALRSRDPKLPLQPLRRYRPHAAGPVVGQLHHRLPGGHYLYFTDELSSSGRRHVL